MNRPIKILFLSPEQEKIAVVLTVLKGGDFPFDSLEVESPEGILPAIESFHPDIILSVADTSAPAAAVLGRLRSLKKTLPLIIITGPEGESGAIELLSAGAEDYLLLAKLERLPKLIKNTVNSYLWEKMLEDSEGSDIKETGPAKKGATLSADRYRLLFKAGPLPKLIYDKESYKILDVNEAAVVHYGFSRMEFLQMSLMDLRPKEELLVLYNELEKSKAETEEIRFRSAQHRKKDGTIIKVELFAFDIEFQDTQATMVTCQDITEREAFFEEIQEKTQKLQLAEKIGKIGYWELDLKENSIYWSDEVYNIFGRLKDAGKPEFKELLEYIFPEDLEVFQARQAAAVSGLEELDIEHRIMLPDGSMKWVYERGKLEKDGEGKPVSFRGTVQDITRQKEAEENLKLSEARHRAILHSQANYLMRMDSKGNYTYCNDKFFQDFCWAYPGEGILGASALSSIKEYHHEKVTQAFKDCLANPEVVVQVEIDKLTQDGSVLSTLWDLVCLPNSNGEPLEIQGVGVDTTEQVKAKRALEKSNKRYELVSKATTDVIWDWDAETNQLYWGDGLEKMFGHRPEDISPPIDWWKNNLHPEDVKSVFKGLNAAVNGTEDHWNGEYRLRRACGEYAYVSTRALILRDDQNMPVRILGASRDITETRKLLAMVKTAARLASVGSFEVDLVKDKIILSDTVREIHEIEQDYVGDLSKLFEFIKEGEHRQAVEKAFELAREKDIPIDLEAQITTAKGKERWVRIIAEPESWGGKCLRINGSIQDTDKVKRAELDALKASAEKELILESIGDAFWAVDKDWTVTYWNKHATELLNVSREEALGQHLWELFPDAVDTAFYSNYLKAIQENKTMAFEEYFERTRSWLEVKAYPSAAGLSVYFKDISETKKTQFQLEQLNKDLQVYTEELKAANKGLQQFSYIVSHNLRSPVANILGLADVLRQGGGYPPEMKEYFQEEMINSVSRLDMVISDLNSILEMKGDISEKRERVHLQDLVHSITSGIDHLMKEEQVQLITDFSEKEEFLTIKSYLYSIFQNLIFNSIKYRCPDLPPKIEISTKRMDGKILLSFRDNGIGIDLTRKRDQVFGMYKRFHKHVEGKGMGLFMVKSQVELLGGKIEVQSEVDKGTEFVLEFPED